MAYWRPSGTSFSSTDATTLGSRGEASDSSTNVKEVLYNSRGSHLPLAHQRQLLPIAQLKREILYCVETFQTTILIGETGCGKSTQIPQYLHEAGWAAGGRCIVCTQPRRIAAMAVAARTAAEMGSTLGEEVGYAIRFDSKCNNNTAIKYCTDGLLLRETMQDPLLSKYSVIIVDEAHERSLYTDILLGLLKKIHRRRPDLRVIIASASLDAQELKDFFETHQKLGSSPAQPLEGESACVLSITGRTHPVDVLYLEEPCSDYVRSAVTTCLEIHQSLEEWGDILVFLPGSEDIQRAIDLFESLFEPRNPSTPDLFALPLYSTLPFAHQQLVFSPTPPMTRKIIFATNMAETSVTIEGIKYIVDAGFAKLKYFDPAAGVDALLTSPISKASALQRLGRAGRTQPGKCYRLMTEATFDTQLEEKSVPEMQRVDISWAVLQLKAIGIEDVLHFDFLSPPPVESMLFALEVLYSLGAVNDKCQLTRLGQQMAEMPIEPRLAKCLLASMSDANCNTVASQLVVDGGSSSSSSSNSSNINGRGDGDVKQCTEEMLSIAAMCSVDYPFVSLKARASDERKQQRLEAISMFAHPDGDHMTLLNVFRGYAGALPHDVYGGPSSASTRTGGHSTGASAGRSWCDMHFLNVRVLERAAEIRARLRGMLLTFLLRERSAMSSGAELGSSQGLSDESAIIRRCLIQGYFSNAAQLGAGGRYWTVRGHLPVSVHPLSIIARFGASPEWLLFHDVTHTDQCIHIREVSKIEPRWLVELAEHYYDVSNIRK